MVQSIMIFINEDNKLDFFSYFETEQKGLEYIRTEILTLVKNSRDFIKSKDKSYSREINGVTEIILDYKKFIQYNIASPSKDDYHPKLDDDNSNYSFEFKFGDKLYKLFCDHVNLNNTLNVVNLENAIKLNDIIIDSSKDDIPKYHNANNNYNSQIKSIKEKCIQEITNESIRTIMIKKIFAEENKELLLESQALVENK